MNRLFIELYLDEDVNVLVADLIRARGFSVTTVRDEGMLQKTDHEQLSYCVKHKKTLVTHHNRADFEKLAQQYYNLTKLIMVLLLLFVIRPKKLLEDY